MKREIKFRGLFKGHMVHGNLIAGMLPDGITFYQIERSDASDYALYEVEGETVGQYIGLNDKNGVDIYEGDVCKVWIQTGGVSDRVYGFMFGSVCFIKNKFVIIPFRYEGEICRYFGKDKIYGMLPDEFYHIENIEVIGNIHQNPELCQP
jgi:uncharacterized phage protein (TIGR01671 family)